jgi:AcrR family transcriptional regulator
LLFSGLKELETHGVSDFSLRRVAQDAGVSCAAPYRHFKDKDQLISEIIKFVVDGWVLLSGQISEIFSSDPKALLTELAVSGLRFWIANGSFRTVLTLDSEEGWEERRRELDGFDAVLLGVLDEYCSAMKYDDARKERIKYLILALIYGTVTLIGTGKGDIERSIAYMKCEVDTLIDR